MALLLCVPFTRSAADVDPTLQAQYRGLASEVRPENLARTVQTLAGYGSRVAGYPGDSEAADYVEHAFREIGLENVHRETFRVTVPMDRGAALTFTPSPTASPARIALYPLWPNLVRTSQLPAGGLTAPLIYVGDGRLSHFNGKDVAGSIVMVDFNSRAEWLNAPRLGAKAVLFIAPETTLRGEAEAKFVSIPISIPRFWIRRSDAVPLLAATAGSHAPTVNVRCNMPWESHEASNLFGVIPGADPHLRDQIMVVEAYYDSMSVVPSLAPGAESTCGIASLLELARLYKAHPPARTVYFVATSGHHLALQGIREFLDRHLDAWSPPGIAEKAISKENAGRTGVWLGLLLVACLGGLIVRVVGARREGRRILDAGTWVFGVLSLAALSLNVGLYLSPRSEPLRHPPAIYLWAGLDLTSQTRSVGIFYKGWFYDYREDIQSRFSDVARVCRENAEKIGDTLGFDNTRFFVDGINPINGKDWRNFLPGQPAFDSEAVTLAQGYGVTFASTDDSRALIDTPFDTPERVNIANLTFQTRMLACEFHHLFNDTNAPGDVNALRMPIADPSPWSRMALQGGFATVRGHVTLFNPKKSFLTYPDPALAHSLVVVRNRTKSFMGVRGSMIEEVYDDEKTDERNIFEFHGIAPLTATTTNQATHLAAYHMDGRENVPEVDPKTLRPTGHQVSNPTYGEIDYAPDLGVTGAMFMPLDVMVTTAKKETPIDLFRCVPTAIYDLVDQQSLRALSSIKILDGDSNGEPRMFGYAIDLQDPTLLGSYVEDMAVLFAQPGSRLKILMGVGPGATRLALIHWTPSRKDDGDGYLVAGNPSEAQNADVGVVGIVQSAQPSDPTQ